MDQCMLPADNVLGLQSQWSVEDMRGELGGWEGRAYVAKSSICCDNDEPGEQWVLVVRMDWDIMVVKDDEELQRTGEKA